MFGDTALQPTRGTPAKVNPCNSGRHRIPKAKGLAWDRMRISRGWVGVLGYNLAVSGGVCGQCVTSAVLAQGRGNNLSEENLAKLN